MQKPFVVAGLIFMSIILLMVMTLIIQPPTMPTSQFPTATFPAFSGSDRLGGASSLPILAERMPEFQGISKWWQTPEGKPLTPESLRGKVVLVDFWTYSCINCIRTYPFLREMHRKYADDGLVIVGVHTPEFAFEANPKNVEREINENALTWPMALDPKYQTWNAYQNRYWPAKYLFDREGRLRHVHFGEGAYEESENAIRELLADGGVLLTNATGTELSVPDFERIGTPETYFGLERGDAFQGTVGPLNTTVTLSLASPLAENKWTAAGSWTFQEQFVQAVSKNATFQFRVKANALHLVLDSVDAKSKRLEIRVDGKRIGEIVVQDSTLYDIASFEDGGWHTVEIRVLDPGVRFYAATFS